MSFSGASVLSFESRRAAEMAELIRINGGNPFVAPAVVEAPLEHNEQAFQFAERLFAGEFEVMIFLTGVGAACAAVIGYFVARGFSTVCSPAASRRRSFAMLCVRSRLSFVGRNQMP